MNRVYRLVWREAAGGFVAVGEVGAAHGKRSSSLVRGAVAGAVMGLAGLTMAGSAMAGAFDGTVKSGAATWNTVGGVSTITVTSANVRVDHASYNIGVGEAHNFVMANPNGVALNVITGNSPTSILGQLLSNGRVVILNPNGVLFGAGSVVSVQSLLASTFKLEQFNEATGELSLTRDGSAASVVNEGSITANGGIAALLGATVSNAGSITATGGGVYLMGGERAVFKSSDSSPLAYSLTPASVAASVTNTGSIKAHGGKVVLDGRSLVSAVVNTSGVIEAGSVASGTDGVVRLVGLGGNAIITAAGVINAGAEGSATAELDEGGQLRFTAVPTEGYVPPVQNGPRFVSNWLQGVDKVYDGTNKATVAVNLQALTQGRSFTFSLVDAFFASRHADPAQTLRWNGAQALSRGDQTLYLFPGPLTAAITPKEIRVQVTDKVYDGTDTATVTYRAEDILEGDLVNVGIESASFDSRHAGANKRVDYMAVSDSDDYYMSGVAFGSVAQAELTITAVTDTKVFDGTTASNVTLTAGNAVAGLKGEDTVTGLSQTFDSAAVGDRTLALAGGYIVNDGNEGGNYRVVEQTATGRINPVPDTGNPPTEPGTNPGTDPGTNPGTNPGTTPGTNPGTNPGTVPDRVSDVTGETGGSRPTPINVDLAGLGDLLTQFSPTAAGDEEEPDKIKARRRTDRSPVRVMDGGVRVPATAQR